MKFFRSALILKNEELSPEVRPKNEELSLRNLAGNPRKCRTVPWS
jgi:hypothetical protein